MNENKSTIIGTTIFLVIIGFAAIGGLWGMGALYKGYKVWSYAQDGKAELARAEFEKQISTVQARAEVENAKLKAEAEVARAEGVAKANAIIGDSLKGNEAYLKYLWINNMNDQSKEVIYVPTEANLPILEAGKR